MAVLAGDFAWASSCFNQDYTPWAAQAAGGYRLATLDADTQQWYAVGFATARQIDTVTFDMPHSTFYATTIVVEASHDSITWTTVHTQSGLSNGTNRVVSMTGVSVPVAQYWRIRGSVLNSTRLEFEYVRWTEGTGAGTLTIPGGATLYGMADAEIVDGSVAITASATDLGGPEFLDDLADPWRGKSYYVDYDYGSAISAKNLLVVGDHATNVLNTFKLYHSDDGANWTLFHTQTTDIQTLVGDPREWLVLNFEDVGATDPGSHRYWRVEITGYGGSGAELLYMIFLEGTTNTTLASGPPTPGTWELADGSTWSIVGMLHRRVTSTIDEYGTAEYGASRYGGYSIVDSEDVSSYLMSPLSTRRGKNYFRDSFRAGSARVLLDNADGAFSDTATHYTRPGDFVELAVEVDSGATTETRPLFFGRIDSARDLMTPSGLELLELVVYDAFPDLAGLETPGVAAPGVGSGETFRTRMARLIEESSEAVGELEQHGTAGTYEDPTLLPTLLSENRLSEIQRTVATEGGEFWINPGPLVVGDDLRPEPVIAGRGWPTATRSAAVQAAFGDTDIGITNAVRSSERAHIVNEATVGNDGGTPQTYRIETASLIAPYGRRTLRVTNLLGDTDADALALATHLVDTLKDLSPAVRSVTVPVVDGASLLAATGLEFLDLISYSIDGLAAWSLTGYAHVIGISHSIEAGSDWTVTLTLDETQAVAP